MTPKNYITQINAEDLRELSALTNLQPGFLVAIEKTPDGVRIGIDKTALALAINGFVANGGTYVSAADCTTVSFDPPI